MRLDTLGEHDGMKFVAERDDRLEQRVVMFALPLGTHEGSVDLDDSRKQECEVGERRVSSTEVVKRDANSDSTQMRHRVNCFGDIERSEERRVGKECRSRWS